MTTADPDRVVRASYASRLCSLEPDPSHLELGERNHSASDYNRENVHHRALGGLAVLASLTRVEYGRWREDNACLLGLRFQFQKGSHEILRFRRADIFIELRARPVASPDDDPAIENYGPKALTSMSTGQEHDGGQWAARWSKKTQAESSMVFLGATFNTNYSDIRSNDQSTLHAGHVFNITNVYEGDRTGSAETVRTERERERTAVSARRYATEVGSDGHRARGHKKENCLKIWMKENSHQADGVPMELRAALVFRYKSDTQAFVSIKTDLPFDVMARPWTKDDPILLREGVAFGEGVRGPGTVDFSTLTDNEWRQIVTPDLSRQDRLRVA